MALRTGRSSLVDAYNALLADTPHGMLFRQHVRNRLMQRLGQPGQAPRSPDPIRHQAAVPNAGTVTSNPLGGPPNDRGPGPLPYGGAYADPVNRDIGNPMSPSGGSYGSRIPADALPRPGWEPSSLRMPGFDFDSDASRTAGKWGGRGGTILLGPIGGGLGYLAGRAGGALYAGGGIPRFPGYGMPRFSSGPGVTSTGGGDTYGGPGFDPNSPDPNPMSGAENY